MGFVYFNYNSVIVPMNRATGYRKSQALVYADGSTDGYIRIQ